MTITTAKTPLEAVDNLIETAALFGGTLEDCLNSVEKCAVDAFARNCSDADADHYIAQAHELRRRIVARDRAIADINETEPSSDACPLHGPSCPTWALLGADA